MIVKKFLAASACLMILAAGGAQAGGDAAKGEAMAGECAACHGDNGQGDGDTFPSIVGQDEATMLQALLGFKSGDKEGVFMPDVVAELSDEDLANVAAYYATLPAE